MMGRFIDALFGDIEKAVRRDIERIAREVTREARSHAPLGSGLIAESVAVGQEKALRTVDGWSAPERVGYELRTADGRAVRDAGVVEPHRDHVYTDMSPAQAEQLKARRESTCGGGPGLLPMPMPMIPMDIPADSPIAKVIREYAERGINGGHEWVEVNLSSSDEVVAWYCSRCDEQRYAEGW